MHGGHVNATTTLCWKVAHVSLLLLCCTAVPASSQSCGSPPEVFPTGSSYAIDVSGTTVVLGDGGYVTTIDVHDPFHPRRLTSVAVGGGDVLVSDIKAHRGHAFVAYWNQVEVLDITDPLYPTSVASLECDSPEALTIENDLAFVVGSELCVYDVRDPAAPLRLSSTNISDVWGLSVALTEQYLYVGGYRYLQAYDISDPSHPEQLWRLVVTDDQNESVKGIACADDWLYLAGTYELVVVDVSQPHFPKLTRHAGGFSCSEDIVVDGDRLYLSGCLIKIFDISQPGSPEVLSSIYPPCCGQVNKLVVKDRLGFAAVADAHLQVFDFGDDALPSHIGSFNTPDAFKAALLNSDVLLLAANGYPDQIVAMDIRHAQQPTVISTLPFQGWIRSINVYGTTALCATEDTLTAIDFSRPTEPTTLGAVNPLGRIKDVDVDGTFAFLTTDRLTLRTVDVSHPRTMAESGYLPLALAGRRVAAAEGIAAVSLADAAGIVIVDVSDPRLPSELSRIDDVPAWVGPMAINDGFLWVAASEDGLVRYDLHDPRNPMRLEPIEWVLDAVGVAGDNDLMLVFDAQFGARVLLARDPTDVRQLVAYPLDEYMPEVEIGYGKGVMAASGYLGALILFDLQGCGSRHRRARRTPGTAVLASSSSPDRAQLLER